MNATDSANEVASAIEELASVIGDPDAAAAAQVRDALLGRRPEGDAGRLGELAAWWAGVRGDAAAGVPGEVRALVLGGDRPDAGLALPEQSTIAAAVTAGRDWVDAAVDSGVDLVLLTVAVDLPARTAIAAVERVDAVTAAGWPMERGLDDDAWVEEVVRLRDSLHTLIRDDVERFTGGDQIPAATVLTGIGDPHLAAAVGVLLTCAGRRTPVLLDGFGALAAALLAQQSSFAASQWWRLANGAPGELGGQAAGTLQQQPLLDLGLSLADGAGARLGHQVLLEASRLLATPA